MGTKANPGIYDCHDVAEPDEPTFTLVSRDPDFGKVVEYWAKLRQQRINRGEKPEADREKVHEARRCAQAGRDWRQLRRRALSAGAQPEAGRGDHAFPPQTESHVEIAHKALIREAERHADKIDLQEPTPRQRALTTLGLMIDAAFAYAKLRDFHQQAAMYCAKLCGAEIVPLQPAPLNKPITKH